MRRAALILFSLLVLAAGGLPAGAHTETDLVAAPAGGETTVAFRPTHGCGDSPTVTVRVRVPVEGASGSPVEGWSVTSEEDGSGNTLVSWQGGSLQADQAGTFAATFIVPGQVGEVLLFPAIQRCANGEELAWISGDPNDPYPAPRLLVLAPGSAPAATLDEVPPEAPGRDRLAEVVDFDEPQATTTTLATTSTAETVPSTTTGGTTTPETTTTTPSPPGSGGGEGVAVWALGLVAAVGIVASWAGLRRRRRG